MKRKPSDCEKASPPNPNSVRFCQGIINHQSSTSSFPVHLRHDRPSLASPLTASVCLHAYDHKQVLPVHLLRVLVFLHFLLSERELQSLHTKGPLRFLFGLLLLIRNTVLSSRTGKKVLPLLRIRFASWFGFRSLSTHPIRRSILYPPDTAGCTTALTITTGFR